MAIKQSRDLNRTLRSISDFNGYTALFSFRLRYDAPRVDGDLAEIARIFQPP